jgi:hypothetical protein
MIKNCRNLVKEKIKQKLIRRKIHKRRGEVLKPSWESLATSAPEKPKS